MRYFYLATPYSKYPGGLEMAFEIACMAAAQLIEKGVRVYSPIAHTHPIATHGAMDPLDHEIWLPADEPFMRHAHGLIVLKAASWEQSYGIGEEIKAFQMSGKPIIYMEPGVVPMAEIVEALHVG